MIRTASRSSCAAGDEPDRLDDRQALALEPAQQRPLAARRPLGQLLQRVERAVVLDEAHDVAADPADQVDDPLRLPLLERRVPRQVEEARVARARDELELRRGISSRAIVELSNACTPPGLAITVLCLTVRLGVEVRLDRDAVPRSGSGRRRRCAPAIVLCSISHIE